MEPKSKSPNSILKVVKFLIAGVFAAALSYFFLFPQLFYCQTIYLSDFRQLPDGVFVSPAVKPDQQQLIQKVVSGAEMRVDSFYSGQKSQPIFIICTSPEQYEKYCNGTEGEGCSVGTPWGETWIVLNLDGINIDVTSHELSHVEMLARLGWWKITFDVPQWFNEGVALMLDRRFVEDSDPVGRYVAYYDEWLYYTGGGQIILELDEINTLKGFFKGSQKQVMLAYMTSGMEVSYWMASMKRDGFLQFLKLAGSGASFENAYRSAEKINRIKYANKLPVNPLRLSQFYKNDE